MTPDEAQQEPQDEDETWGPGLPEAEELWDADPGCKHDIQCAPGGGIKCTKCRGWFCF